MTVQEHHELVDILPGNILTKWERGYLLTGVVQLLTAPLQLLVFGILLSSQDADVVTISPWLCILSVLVPGSILSIMIRYFCAGSFDRSGEYAEYHSVTLLPPFAFHWGVLAVTRIVIIVIVRTFTKHKEFRRNDPIIFMPPDWWLIL